MKMSKQDKYYLDVEADAFFERNRYDFSVLPERKMRFMEYFITFLAKENISNILEIGCHIGDLLNYTVAAVGASAGCGIEPSEAAIKVGNEQFSDKCKFFRGVAANNAIFSKLPDFDLVVVNDVFCWISRETLFQSIANIDNRLKDGGFLLIRDFLPDQRVRNHNHHTGANEIYCHKIPGSHASLFTHSGIYQVVQSRIFVDGDSELSITKDYDFTENRWMDVLLKKGWA